MSFLRSMAVLFAIVFLVLSVASLMPAYSQNGLLFGSFEVDRMHVFVYSLSGLFALFAAVSQQAATRYFKVVGLFYAAMTIISFWRAGNVYIMHANMVENWLHLSIAVFALYFGFIVSKRA